MGWQERWWVWSVRWLRQNYTQAMAQNHLVQSKRKEKGGWGNRQTSQMAEKDASFLMNDKSSHYAGLSWILFWCAWFSSSWSDITVIETRRCHMSHWIISLFTRLGCDLSTLGRANLQPVWRRHYQGSIVGHKWCWQLVGTKSADFLF